MVVRFLLLLLAFALVLFAQIGTFGPVSEHPKAGDLAPEIVFKDILHSGGASPWTPASLLDRVTVMVFYPDTTHNLESVSNWNALVDQFSKSPIQFVWITGEEKSSLMPWLRNHPVKGWMFRDPEGATGRSYGLEFPATVIIGTDGRIIGFDDWMLPTADMLNAVLENRIATDPPKSGLTAIKEFAERDTVLLNAEPRRIPRPNDHKPNFAPSYTVHISPSNTRDGGNFSGDDFESIRDLRLRDVVAHLDGINPIRVVLPRAIDDGKRYNFSLVLPKPESQVEVNNRIRQGIEAYFHLAIVREKRLLDVYVVTTVDGTPPKTKIPPRDQSETSLGAFSSSVQFRAEVSGESDALPEPPMAVNIDGISSVWLQGTMDQFCNTLESALDRPVVNETSIEGEYRFEVKASEGVDNDFLDRLRDELNLTVYTARRTVEVVVLKPR